MIADVAKLSMDINFIHVQLVADYCSQNDQAR